MDHQVRKHKNLGRLVAILGLLPGAWFLLATKTEIGNKLDIKCGYWIIALVLLTAVWIIYLIFTKILMRDIGNANMHANSLDEARHYKMMYASTFVELALASTIILLSLFGFLVTDLQCYLEKNVIIHNTYVK